MTLQDTAMLHDFVPMSERRPLKWPIGKRLALMITFNLEEPPESHLADFSASSSVVESVAPPSVRALIR